MFIQIHVRRNRFSSSIKLFKTRKLSITKALEFFGESFFFFGNS
jgi:hypothetical protein